MARHKGGLSATDISFEQLTSVEYSYSILATTEYQVLTADSYSVLGYFEELNIADVMYLDIVKLHNDEVTLDDAFYIEADKNIMEVVAVTEALSKDVTRDYLADDVEIDELIEVFFTKGFEDDFSVSEAFVTEGTKNIVDTVVMLETLSIDQVTYDDYFDAATMIDTVSKDVERELPVDSVSVTDSLLLIPIVIINNTFNGSKVGRSTFG